MYFSAEPAQIAEIKRLASGAVTPFYRRATNEGIQLFLAGSVTNGAKVIHIRRLKSDPGVNLLS